jgi:hypothetical protein
VNAPSGAAIVGGMTSIVVKEATDAEFFAVIALYCCAAIAIYAFFKIRACRK